MNPIGLMKGDVIQIGEDTRITVRDVWSNNVLLAIDAPGGPQIIGKQSLAGEKTNQKSPSTQLIQGKNSVWRVTTSRS